MNPVLEAALGNRTAAWALLFITAYGEGHANRIASTFDLAVSVVRDQLLRLEANGVLVSRMIGRARVFQFNERSPTARNLRVFLREEIELLPRDDVRRHFRQRQRPRRTTKPPSVIDR
ncbi:MAG: ArsR family transcriptional regulator [Gammaproteobacteria bacterium]|nr:ArsR family transcriptional regulator [Gammaproteobacteria bacterium]MDE0225618.1 ArsR family transcriptional regulator [Gammaproteobacteria bacterium]MDE0451743.1 ArsR family transcriptional regulator [Gammaproteobacteria bacterium]